MEKSSVKELVLDALNEESAEGEGYSDPPVLPLVGSLNVPISSEEESDE